MLFDVIAFDFQSSRSKDQDGRLHVSFTNISKANVCPYKGGEIPGAEQLGLQPDKIYYLYRDPAELAKAAPTFNNLPLLSRHVPVSAEKPRQDLIIGSTGTDAAFNDPYLGNSLVIWDQKAIDAIESGEKMQLSCAYRYTPVMEPGEAGGVPFDGRMTQIAGNHVAQVREGRAGDDVVVADGMPQDAEFEESKHPRGEGGKDAAMPRRTMDAARLLVGYDEHEGFQKLEGELAHEKGVRDPAAVAAAIGRKKYGARAMAAKSAAGRDVRRPITTASSGRDAARFLAGDEAITTTSTGDNLIMPKTQRAATGLSRKALLARGALATYLAPKLAKDAQIDLRPVLLGTTADNWLTAKPTILDRLKKAVDGKLAQDANIEDAIEMLDRLDNEGEGEVDQDRAVMRGGRPSRDAAELPPDTDNPDPEKEEDNPGLDNEEDDGQAAIMEFLRDKLSPEDHAALDGLVKDARARRAARDAASDPQERAERLRAGEGDARRRTAADRRRAEDDREAAEDAARRRGKAAMDAAIDQASAEVRRRVVVEQSAIREAERIARPYVGELLAQDSAEAVYRLALDTLGVKHADIKEVGALRAVLQAQPLPGRPARMAHDHRPANSNNGISDLAKEFPGADRLKRVAV